MSYTPTPWKATQAKSCWCLSADAVPAYWIATGGIGPRAREDIEFAARAVNSHAALLAASRAFLDVWRRAGPQGSAQFEKFDTAVRMAEMAIAYVEGTANAPLQAPANSPEKG